MSKDYNLEPLVIEPPEIREVTENYRGIEFYVELGNPRPEIEVFDLMRDWLANRGPITVHFVIFAYRKETADEPGLLQATLFVGEPIDMG